MNKSERQQATPFNSQRMPGSRGQQRMSYYNTAKYLNDPIRDVWEENSPDIPDFKPTGPPKPRQTNTSRTWKESKQKKGAPQAQIVPKAVPVENPPPVKAKTEDLKNEPMWQGPYVGTHPVVRNYSQNPDFSTFPVLVERVYQDLEVAEPRIRREMPFCSFQHVCTSVLNATLIDHVRTYNAEDRYADEESPMNLIPEDLCLPAAVNEYLKLVTDAATPQGDVVRMNIPPIAVPDVAIAAVDNVPAIPAGTFGVADVARHNVYEAYVSPYVTSQYVIATVQQNQNNQHGPWQPLPDGLFPVGAMPTQNLLGYRPNVERFNPEGLNALMNIAFPNGQDMASRIRWQPELVARVSGSCRRLQDRYKMHIGKIIPGQNPAPTAWTCVTDVLAAPLLARVAVISGTVRSSTSLGASQSNIVGLMGQKRHRF